MGSGRSLFSAQTDSTVRGLGWYGIQNATECLRTPSEEIRLSPNFGAHPWIWPASRRLGEGWRSVCDFNRNIRGANHCRSLERQTESRSGRADRCAHADEMPTGKGLAGTALQVAFKATCFGLIGEGKVTDQVPRAASFGRLVLSGILAGKTRAKVVGESCVTTTGVARALQDVNVVHGRSTLKRVCGGKFAEDPDFGVTASAGVGTQERGQRLGRRSKPTFAKPTVGSIRRFAAPFVG